MTNAYFAKHQCSYYWPATLAWFGVQAHVLPSKVLQLCEACSSGSIFAANATHVTAGIDLNKNTDNCRWWNGQCWSTPNVLRKAQLGTQSFEWVVNTLSIKMHVDSFNSSNFFQGLCTARTFSWFQRFDPSHKKIIIIKKFGKTPRWPDTKHNSLRCDFFVRFWTKRSM